MYTLFIIRKCTLERFYLSNYFYCNRIAVKLGRDVFLVLRVGFLNKYLDAGIIAAQTNGSGYYAGDGHQFPGVFVEDRFDSL